jgi:hypothetical protein
VRAAVILKISVESVACKQLGHWDQKE